jgi:hypothetical protein
MMSDVVEANQRLLYAGRAAERLIRYRDTVNKLERCPGTEKHLGDRARSAENDTRVLLKCAIDSLNDLRDSRAIEAMAAAGAKLSGKGEALDFGKAIRGAKDILREKWPETSLGFLDECETLLHQYGLDVRSDEEVIQSKVKVPDGEEHSLAFSPKVRPGHAGRVSSAEFFGQFGSVITYTDPAFADDDCHHRQQNIKSVRPELTDYYAHLIGAFAHSRDSMARHAKVAEHFGRPHIKANPVAVIVAIAIVAAVLIVAGATLLIGCAADAWSGSACDWGWGLLIAGIAIGVTLACIEGGCVIVLQGIPVAVIGG